MWRNQLGEMFQMNKLNLGRDSTKSGQELPGFPVPSSDKHSPVFIIAGDPVVDPPSVSFGHKNPTFNSLVKPSLPIMNFENRVFLDEVTMGAGDL